MIQRKAIERVSLSDDRFPAFCRWMVEQGMEIRDLLYMIEKPNHYQSEWNEFLSQTETAPESDQ